MVLKRLATNAKFSLALPADELMNEVPRSNGVCDGKRRACDKEK